jgi:hypothetical protein
MELTFGDVHIDSSTLPNITLPLYIVGSEDLNVNLIGNVKGLYTIIMYDIDAPNGTYLHYLVINFDPMIGKGTSIVEYVPPQRENHRYIYEVYKQNKQIRTNIIPRIVPFDVQKYIKDNNLIKYSKIQITTEISGSTSNIFPERSNLKRESPRNRSSGRTIAGPVSPRRRSPERISPERDTAKRGSAERTLPRRRSTERTLPGRRSAERTLPVRRFRENESSARTSSLNRSREISPVRTLPRRRSTERTLPERTLSGNRSQNSSPVRTLPRRRSVERRTQVNDSPKRKSKDHSSSEDESESDVKYHGFVKGLSGQDAKYCTCLVEVGQKSKGKYNPYAVCSKSTGGHVQKCGRYYDYELMPLEYLLFLADKYKANVRDRDSRESVIDAIMQRKAETGEI